MILLGCGYKDASHFGLALVFLRLNLLFVDYRIESEESFISSGQHFSAIVATQFSHLFCEGLHS